MSSSSNSARLLNRQANQEKSVETSATMPATLRSAELNRQSFRYFRSFQQGQVFGETDLRRVLKSYASHYNRVRTHLSLCKDAPLFRRRQTVANIVSIPILGGLHHQYVRG
jgi:hypothetical protein